MFWEYMDKRIREAIELCRWENFYMCKSCVGCIYWTQCLSFPDRVLYWLLRITGDF